jgi:hypothetical protein
MLVALLLATWVLVLLGLFDLFSLTASFAGLTLARSVIAHRISPAQLIRNAWRQIVSWFLDLLDDVHVLATKARTSPARAVEWTLATLPRGPDLAWAASFGAVIVGAGTLRLVDVLAHPSPAWGDQYLQRITGVVAVGARTLPANDLYGVDLLLGAFARVVTVDPTMLVHLAPAVVASVLVATLIACLRRWNVSRGPTLIASMAVALAGVASWFPPLGGIDPFGIEVAMAVAMPALVFASEAIANGLPGLGSAAERRHLAAASIGLAAFLHPAVGAAMFVGLVLGVVVSWAMSQRDAAPLARLVVWVATGGIVGLAPIAIAGWTRGDVTAPFRSVLAEVGARTGEPASPSVPSWPALALAVVAMALLLAPELPALMRRRPDDDPPATADPSDHTRIAQRLVAAGTLTIAALAVPERFGLPVMFRSSDVVRVLIPFGGLAIAFALDEVLRLITSARQRSTGTGLPKWAEFATASVTVLALFGSSLPMQFDPGGVRLQPDAVANALFEIKTSFPENSWTVVADDASLPQVTGKGFFLPVGSFAQTYRPDTWRFDPRAPELAVPSRHTFIVLAPPARSDNPTTTPDPRPELEVWIERYGATHDDLSLFSDDDGVAVWHIDRPPSEDKEVLDEIARLEREARAAGSAVTQP